MYAVYRFHSTTSASRAVTSNHRQRKPGSTPSLGSGAARSHRLLIVEDDLLIAMDVEETLRGAGYDVVGVASRCSQAVEIAGLLEPDLAIMDVRLAGRRDGIETAVIIRQHYDIPSMFVTAQPESELGDRAGAAMPCGWLNKPFQRRQLLDAVHQALQE